MLPKRPRRHRQRDNKIARLGSVDIAATAVTLNDPEGHSPVAGLFKCNLSNICVEFYTILTDSVLAISLRYRSFLYESGDYRQYNSLF